MARTLLSKTGKLTAKAIDLLTQVPGNNLDLLTQVPESKTWKGIYDTGIDFYTELGEKKSLSGLCSLKNWGFWDILLHKLLETFVKWCVCSFFKV